MPRMALLRSALLLACLSTTHALLAADVFIEGGTLVDPASQTVRVGNLLIVDGVIAGFPDHVPEGFAGEVIAAEGTWIIPGLRDMHVHSQINGLPGGKPAEPIGTPEAARRMLRVGVTGFLDLFHVEDMILPMRDRERAMASNLTGKRADLFAAGPCLTAPGGHCTEYGIPTRTMSTPEEARRQVDELAAKQPDVVKIVYEHLPPELAAKSWRPPKPSIDKPTLAAAVAAARAHNLPTVIHIRSWEDIRDAAEVGASAVTHLPATGTPPPGLVEQLRAAGTVVIPTLAVGDPYLLVEPQALASPVLRAVAGEKLIAAYEAVDPNEKSLQPMLGGLRHAQKTRFESLRQLAAAGVTLVAGTDSGNPLTIHGYSLHRELELMVAAGLSPWQALAAATVGAGRFLGRGWGLGVGEEGTVVLLEASPIDDIRNTQRIRAVVHHGVVVARGE